jgi:hypothetical protein
LNRNPVRTYQRPQRSHLQRPIPFVVLHAFTSNVAKANPPQDLRAADSRVRQPRGLPGKYSLADRRQNRDHDRVYSPRGEGHEECDGDARHAGTLSRPPHSQRPWPPPRSRWKPARFRRGFVRYPRGRGVKADNPKPKIVENPKKLVLVELHL